MIRSDPSCPKYGLDMSAFLNGGNSHPTKHNPAQVIRPARLSDGLAVIFTTRSQSKQTNHCDYAHGLYLPYNQKEIYERNPLGHSEEVIDGPAIRLEGQVELVDFSGSDMMLGYVLGALSIEASIN